MDEVEIVDYDPRWPLLFNEEAKRLRAVLDPSLIVGLEHFGSTAVPGLSAKPILDIDLIVSDLTQLPQAISHLQELGYEHQGDLGTG